MTKLTEIHQQHGALMGERNGVTLPVSYRAAEEEHLALRKNILLCDYSHFGIAAVSGESAWSLLNQLVSGDVSSIRDEQAMYSLLLDELGHVVTDLYIACDDERFLLLSEWVSGETLCEMLRAKLADHDDEFEDIESITSLTPEWGMLHFEGPFAWELLAEVYGMDIIGLPFQEHMHVEDDLILLRSGKHGEYSYKLMGPQDLLADVWEQMLLAGDKYDMRTGGLNYQRMARLENPCWEPAIFNAYTRCPIALQMQWAVRYDKESFTGLESLSERVEQGTRHRLVGMTIPGKPQALPQRGDKVMFEDRCIGEVIVCDYSADLEACLGRLFLTDAWAWADIDTYQVITAGGPVAVTTSAIPFARNYSFLINPSEHSYVDSTRPRDLLQQFEWQKQKEEQDKAEAAAAVDNAPKA
ncbi:aminomethyltransferase family protein [Serratia fonticola]|uniref:aminomethyltransferase family protein n=1 Tax=Serratia fonticola TaxID=47917 RepID=UPI0003AC7DEE|nr:aminomethyltransferase family protein [Serratia fonticola]ERK16516.1 Aminomethyltransferase [Serratia fonticola AU-P3(3)]MEB7885489.1 aminomethyltransferase family protein [Serratia fonticola]